MVTPTGKRKVGETNDQALSNLSENPVSASLDRSDCLTIPMTQGNIIERLRAVESASPDFLDADEGRCVTCYHRNLDGPEAAALIEEMREALDDLCASVEREEQVNASLSGTLMADVRKARAALAKVEQQ